VGATKCRVMFACLLLSLVTSEARAQNWTFDARQIAIGGVGGNNNVAWGMIEDQRRYGSIVLPFGLLQVLRNADIFRPESDDFDLIRAVEYATAPLHYMVDRDSSDTVGQRLVVDIRNAELSRDLNRYRGFVPVNQPAAGGLAVPRIGGTIKLVRGAGGAFHGLYLAGGGYLSMRAEADIDQRLVEWLGSATNMYLPQARFSVTTMADEQLAAVGTVGYRGRLALRNAASERDGVYLATNFNYLHGFRYEDQDVQVTLDTDRSGLLTTIPGSSPLSVARLSSTSGSGYSVDAGVGAVVGRIEFGAGASGIGNHIDWSAVEQTRYRLSSLLNGDDDFAESPTIVIGDRRVELPVEYRGNVGYHLDRVSVLAEAGRGLNGGSMRGGIEYRLGAIELRGGAYYVRERWQPTGGVGVNLGRRVGLDVASYWTVANVEREPRQVIAASLRINVGS
jgi:hypothetical protein